MKVNFKFAAIAVAALSMGLASCSKNNDATTKGSEIIVGEPTTMSLVISTPSVSGTRAVTDENATDAEIAINTVDVLIYAKTGSGSYLLEQHEEFTAADFEAVVTEGEGKSTGAYKMLNTSKFTTTTGSKKIFVLANYPGELPTEANSQIKTLTDLVYTLSAKDALGNATNGLAMSSVMISKDFEVVAEDIDRDDADGKFPAKNIVKADLSRMVAKITVQETASLAKTLDEGGIFSDLQFAIGHINKKSYAIAQENSKDPNYESYTASDFFGIAADTESASEYITIDASDATPLNATAVYVPENTSQTFDTEGKNLTYISVRMKYAPAFFCDATGTSKGENTEAKSFWTVSDIDGTIHYFDVQAEAEAYFTNVDTPADDMSEEYVGGVCYYRAYLNPTGSGAKKYDVLRNNYYQAKIAKIKALGTPKDQAVTATEDTYIVCDVNVIDWIKVTDEYELN